MSLRRSVLIKSKMRRAKRSLVAFLPFPKFRACVAHEGNDETQLVKTLHSVSELAQLPGPLFLAIGVFDGVHLGHQAVISTSTSHAQFGSGTPVVITFDPHPLKVLRPHDAPHLLTATPHKIALIRDLGVEHLLVINFDRKFAATSPENFIEQLAAHSKPLREICVGHEWSFGKDRRGNLDILKKLGAQFHFDVVGIPPVKVNGAVVSSTAIRRAVEKGDLATAAAMLGREYTVLGTLHHGVVNLGYRPTVSSGKSERVLEIYLLDFDRDIYGEDVEVRFVRYLRPERKFDSLEALVRQIELDVRQARELCAT